jgi:predicted outer membrane repeat protein
MLWFAVLVAMGLSIPALADDVEDTPPDAEVVVGTLDELRAAVDAAEDGDVIYISSIIYLKNETLETDKDITLARLDGFGKEMLELLDGSSISGFTFEGNSYYSTAVVVDFCYENAVIIDNCKFMGEKTGLQQFIFVVGNYPEYNKVTITNCDFESAGNIAVSCRANTTVSIENCNFSGNNSSTQGGAINSAGIATVVDCTFTGNTATAGGAICSSGELTVSGCTFSGNIARNAKFGADIFTTGTLSISDEAQDGAGFYDETTGEKVSLPLVDNSNVAKYVYLTTEQAAEYFAPVESEPEQDHDLDPDQEEDQDPNPDPEQDADPEPDPEPEQQPETDDPAPDPEPDPAPVPDDEQEPTQQPQEADGADDSGNNDYIPVVYHPPVVRPSTPSVTVEAEAEADAVVEQPKLVCGGAKIDTSRSVVLAGYGDGLLHEDDPLTRAQMATIIYRLLDDSTVSAYSVKQETFTDVAPDSWYNKYVQTIHCAGIVNGVGMDKYSPNSLVTWGQIVTVLSRFVEAQDCELQNIQYSGWAVDAVKTAVALGWIEDSADFNPDAIISRGELVQLVNGMLELYR